MCKSKLSQLISKFYMSICCDKKFFEKKRKRNTLRNSLPLKQ